MTVMNISKHEMLILVNETTESWLVSAYSSFYLLAFDEKCQMHHVPAWLLQSRGGSVFLGSPPLAKPCIDYL